jgi:AcrR family transcriptional regulator
MTQVESRQQRRRHETHQRLLEAALVVFGRRGYEGATVDEIAQAAGYSKGAFYFHFNSKEEIFLELLRTYVVQGVDSDSGESGPSSDIPVRELLSPLLLEFWAHAARDARVRDSLREFYISRMEHIAGSAGSAAAVPGAREEIAQLIAAVEDGLILQQVLGIAPTGRSLISHLSSLAEDRAGPGENEPRHPRASAVRHGR